MRFDFTVLFFALFAVFASATIIPVNVTGDAVAAPTGPVADSITAAAASYVSLHIPDWTHVQSRDKAANNGWGGWGAGTWNFWFNWGYLHEHFTVKVYHNNGNYQHWLDIKNGYASGTVIKTLDCWIWANQPPTWVTYINIQTSSPWITPYSSGAVVAAYCS